MVDNKFLHLLRLNKALESFALSWDIWNLKLSPGSKNTPRNLIAGVSDKWLTYDSVCIRLTSTMLLSSLLLSITIWISSHGILLGLWWKTVNLVLFGCSDILFALNHNEIFLSSVLMNSTSSVRLGPEAKRVVSSANNKQYRSVDFGRSLKKIKNKIGPRMLPCGTPLVTSDMTELPSPILTNCFLLLR